MGGILILYHSGVGSTKAIATALYENLRRTVAVEIFSVEELEDISIMNEYDNLIIGFPTYHCSPSTTIQNFIKRISIANERQEKCGELAPKNKNRKRAFIFTTCGLYSANTLRIFAKQCADINIDVVYAKSYRSPASDGSIIAPSMKIWFQFEKNMGSKLKKDADVIQSLFDSKFSKRILPRFKLYSIINFPNKFLGQIFKPKIYSFTNNCAQCGVCIKRCPHNCFVFDKKKGLQHINKNCEHCYRCIHACPNKALSIQKNRPVSKQLNEEFFAKWSSERKMSDTP